MRKSSVYTPTFLTMQFTLALLTLLIISSTSYSERMVDHIDIHAGQRIGMHLMKQDPDLLPPIEPFRDVMSPLSLKHGIEHFSIGIDKVIKGDYEANTLDIYLSWSSEKSSKVRKDVGSNPVVTKYNKVASEVPTEVKGFNLVASSSAQINFIKNKAQTVSYIWISPCNPGDYERYESGMQAIAKRHGVITLARFETTDSEYHTYPNINESPPDYVIFNQWPNSNSISKYFNSKEYKEFEPYLDSGTINILTLQFDSASFYSSTETGFRVAPEAL